MYSNLTAEVILKLAFYHLDNTNFARLMSCVIPAWLVKDNERVVNLNEMTIDVLVNGEPVDMDILFSMLERSPLLDEVGKKLKDLRLFSTKLAGEKSIAKDVLTDEINYRLRNTNIIDALGINLGDEKFWLQSANKMAIEEITRTIEELT